MKTLYGRRGENWLATFLLKDSQEFCCAKVYFYHLKKNEPILTHIMRQQMYSCKRNVTAMYRFILFLSEKKL